MAQTDNASPRKKRNRANKRALIMQSALKVFAEHGFGATTYDMVAKEAGVTKGLVIKYYESKANLASLAIHDFVEAFAQKVGLIVQREKTFAAYIDKVSALFKEHLKELRLVIGLTVTPAHTHLVTDIWGEIFEKKMVLPKTYRDEIGADRFPAVIRQMSSQHFNYVIMGNEQRYDAGRQDILDYLSRNPYEAVGEK